jgi:hypothetical protein
MNKAFVGVIVTLGLSLVACNNDLGSFPVGVPTPIVSLTELTSSWNLSTGAGSVGYTISARTIPGSPNGTVQSFVAKSGREFGIGVYVQACPVGFQKTCPASASGAISQSFLNAKQDDFIFTGLRVQGENGISKIITWTGQQPVLPNPAI